MNNLHLDSCVGKNQTKRSLFGAGRVTSLGCGLLLVVALPLLRSSDAPQGATEPERLGRHAVSRRNSLAAACRESARWIDGQLDEPCSVVVHEPFVVAGDPSEQELHRRYHRSIAPAARAMAAAYFSTTPYEPVTILLFNREETYRRHAARLFGDRTVSRFGYYKPHLRVLLINTSTGDGPLWHELTHALMAFDFPDAPQWFAEGLASLHETGRITNDGSHIEGQVNWRLGVLQEALQTGQLRSVESLMASDDFYGRDEHLHYAHARFVCLYLQHRGVLKPFYRQLRAGRDATAEVFPDRSLKKVDADFRTFAKGLTQQKPSNLIRFQTADRLRRIVRTEQILPRHPTR
ncbi:MAG: hypothetical protein V3R99_10070 [Thermoguttaceae bacterium]